MEFWPWWWGAICMGGLVVASWAFERRLIAGSGSVTRVTTALLDGNWGVDEERLLDDGEALQAALIAATLAEFGGEAPGATAPAPPTPVVRTWAPAYSHAFFLVMVGLGGMIAAVQTGTLAFGWSLGDEFAAFFGSGGMAVAALLVGGFAVGFGTRMGGGCTTGHGLCGVSRFQPGSLVGTGAFFGTGIAVSYAMEWLLR